jgi:ribose/xylose/arabinose/galactoside ABC-type transport system permease subunit
MTIGMMMIARSSGELVSGDTTLSAPPEFAAFFFTGIAGTIIPYLLIPIVITAAMFILLSKTKFGFRVKGIGSNSRAAEYCGVRVVRYQIAIYVIMGLLSALVGIMLVARASGANPAEFTQLPLQAIAAVIIGGTSFGGGKGTVVGTLIGVVIVGSMENFLNLVRVDYYWQFVVQGFIVLAAVCLDHAIRRRDI